MKKLINCFKKQKKLAFITASLSILILLSISSAAASVSDWEFTPQKLVSGDILNIKGSASPGEKIDVLVNFEKTVPISGGKFEYVLEEVKIPEGFNNCFKVEATGAKNLNVRTKMLVWLTKSSEASGNTAIVSQSRVPPGTYTIKIDGDAVEGVSEVNLKIKAFQGIKADSNGNFSYSYNTTAIPPGDFQIKIGGITNGITVQPMEITGSTNVSFISKNFTDKVVYILDHTSDPSEGNWITMEGPYEGRGIQLPQPITITYSGPRFGNYKGVSWNLSSSNDSNYTINYPSTSSYTTLPVYLPGEKVNMSFFGASALEGNVDIYIFNATSKSASGILEAFNTGNIGDLESLFHKNMDGNYKNYSAVLGENGDLLDYDLGSFDTGQYCIVMIQKNDDGSLTVLSATALVVSEYELKASAPANIEEGKNLDISMELEGAPDNSNYTYGAVLVNEQAYRANIEINSNGTINGTSVLVNGENFTDKLGINSSNNNSSLTRNELQKVIQTLIGGENGSIAIGENGQKNLSLTASELPEGRYYLFAGAYDPKNKIAGLTQLEVEITPLLAPKSPVANFTSSVTTGYAPFSVQFTDLSENATEIRWDFGDGEYSTESNPTHTFYGNGYNYYYPPGSSITYLVTLTAINKNGTDNKTQDISVSTPPEPLSASFYSFLDEFDPLSVQFQDNSVYVMAFYKWDFGDGTTSSEANPFHTYSSAGDYTVTLTVTGEWAQSKTSQVISVQDLKAPVADFSASPISGIEPLKVTFTDESTGSSTAWIWDFGDGTNSTEQNPEHTYSAAGNYTVNLRVSNTSGTDSKTATINVLKSTPTITWSTPADITYGTVLNSTQLNAVASVPGTYVYTPPAGTVLDAGTQTLKVDFLPTDAVNYSNAPKSVTINVLTPVQKIQQMTTNIQVLVTSSDLTKKEGNNLISNLDAAIKNLNAGKTKQAIAELNAFIKQIEANMKNGKLSSTQGQSLIDAASSIIKVL